MLRSKRVEAREDRHLSLGCEQWCWQGAPPSIVAQVLSTVEFVLTIAAVGVLVSQKGV